VAVLATAVVVGVALVVALIRLAGRLTQLSHPVVHRWLNAMAVVLVLAGVGWLILLAVAYHHDPNACPWNGCS
jgi:hypothetical protein